MAYAFVLSTSMFRACEEKESSRDFLPQATITAQRRSLPGSSMETDTVPSLSVIDKARRRDASEFADLYAISRIVRAIRHDRCNLPVFQPGKGKRSCKQRDTVKTPSEETEKDKV